jgi:hypothetical protein
VIIKSEIEGSVLDITGEAVIDTDKFTAKVFAVVTDPHSNESDFAFDEDGESMDDLLEKLENHEFNAANRTEAMVSETWDTIIADIKYDIEHAS